MKYILLDIEHSALQIVQENYVNILPININKIRTTLKWTIASTNKYKQNKQDNIEIGNSFYP